MNDREQLREDALAIWRAGLNAVRSERLVADAVTVAGSTLGLGDREVDLDSVRRIAVVGAGKAGAGMAAAMEQQLGPELMEAKRLTGWINVPEDCVRPLHRIHLHGARPAGRNQPTEAGVVGARQILEIVAELGPDDLCLALISGGGSALLPLPEGVSLADKLQVTRHLSATGATIEQLNTVRKQLSGIKGGKLARQCGAGRMFTLIISDVMGDPLEFIASGPTVPDATTPADALAVLAEFDPGRELSETVYAHLRSRGEQPPEAVDGDAWRWRAGDTDVCNVLIGNNARAVDAAGQEAVARGYRPALDSARGGEGSAEEVAERLVTMARRMLTQAAPDCLITGGEPIVHLSPNPGLGGRNQQLVLAALLALSDLPAEDRDRIVLLSGGTDGEDGPTDAAGAILDGESFPLLAERGLDARAALEKNDAYPLFDALGGLIRTGPTHTNVCDLRVLLVGPRGQ